MRNHRAMRVAFSGLALAVAASAAAPAIRVHEIAAPASTGAVAGPSVVVSPEGDIWLTWLQTANKVTALRHATLAPGADRWSEPRTIASGAGWFVNAADFPAMTAGPRGRTTAVWFVNNPSTPATAHQQHGAGYHALFSQTTDTGRNWSAPAPVTTESASVEFVSLAALADGRVLAAWLDGRAKAHANAKAAMRLYARVLGAPGPDVLVDGSVCDCCQTTLTAFPDGTALLAYRGRGDAEVRDIRVARFRGGEWDDSRLLNNDDWRIAGCPVNGPQLASDGGRVAAAWFTAAGNDPRVLATYSPDAGARFLMPLRLSEQKAAGRVATALLHDGAFLVTFVDADGGLWLRRVSPEFVVAASVALHPPEKGRVKGFPRVALRRDYTGGKAAAEIVAAFTVDGARGLRTLRIEVPEGELLEAERNCDCAPTAEQLSGFPIRGTLVGTGERAGTLRARHFEVPGIFAEGEREFRVAPDLAAHTGDIGRQFLGRIEKRGGAWWLFELRFIAPAPR